MTYGRIEKPARRIKARQPLKRGRYSFSVVEEAVLNPAYKAYRGGRVEVFDRRDKSGYAIYEARILLPSAFFDAFYDLWDGKESEVMPYINWLNEYADMSDHRKPLRMAKERRTKTNKDETNAAVVKKTLIKTIIKEKGLCRVCAQRGRDIYSGENEGARPRQDKRNWKRRRLTKYKQEGIK